MFIEVEQLGVHSRSTSPANGIFHTSHQSNPPHMSNFIIFISSPRPLYVIPYKVTINAIKQKIFCRYECLICISHDIKESYWREVLKVRDCSFNLRTNSLLHIGKDVLTSYVGKMVESLFFRSLQLSHTDIAYQMLLLLRSVAIRPTWVRATWDRGTKTELQKWIEKNFE